MFNKLKSAYNKAKNVVSKVLTPSKSPSKVNPNQASAIGAASSAISTNFNQKSNPKVTAQSYGVQYGPEAPAKAISYGSQIGPTRAPEVGVKSYGVQYGPAPAPRTINSGKQSVGGSADTNTLMGSPYLGTTTISSTTTGGSGSTGTISSGGGAAVTVPSAPGSTNPRVDTTTTAGVLSGYYQRQPDGTFTEVKQDDTVQTTEKKSGDIEKRIVDYIDNIPMKESVYDDREVKRAQKERQRIQQALQAPTSELNAVIAQQQRDLLQLRQTGSQEGVTEAVYGDQQAAVNYNAAIRALPLQASIASLKGELELAQDYLQELVTVKTDQINRQYEYRKQVFSAVAGILEEEDKRAYDKITKENDRAYEEEQELVKIQKELSQMVMQNAPESVRTNVNNRIWAASSIQGAIEAAGQHGVEPKTSSNSVSTDSKGERGFLNSKVESSVREDVVAILDEVEAGNTTKEKAYAKLRKLYSPSEVTDASLMDLLEIPVKEVVDDSKKNLPELTTVNPNNRIPTRFEQDLQSNGFLKATFNFLFNK